MINFAHSTFNQGYIDIYIHRKINGTEEIKYTDPFSLQEHSNVAFIVLLP